MKLIVSPWAGIFEEFVQSIHSRALLVAPYITDEPLQRISSQIDRNSPPQIEVITNLAVDSLLDGSVDAKAVAAFCMANSITTVRHLPGLHAKAYVADDHTAIITSGNLTSGSLFRNYEYGIQISDRGLVSRIAKDLQDYGDLGTEVSIAELDHLASLSDTLRERHTETLESARLDIKREFEKQIETARETLRHLRAGPGESTNSIFARTVVYVLRNGPLVTQQVHALIESIHPDLCDNSIDRVINGVRFGRRWKHMVRNAQQTLKSQGVIELAEGKWSLVTLE